MEPRRAYDLTDKDEPIRLASKTDKEEPKRPQPNKES